MKNNNYKFQLHFGLKHFVFLSFLLFAININALSQDKILTELPSYSTQRSNEIWDFISKHQYGVAGSGFVGKDQFIGMCSAKPEKGGPWTPIDGYKHTLCGELYLSHNGKFYETMGDDGDIDFYIFPDSAFEYLVLKSKNHNGNMWVTGTVLGEVSFKEVGDKIENDGATYLQSRPRLEYQNIGVYGAWVTDVDAPHPTLSTWTLGLFGEGTHQDNHPEIHPIEQMWQTKKVNDQTTEFYLFSMHDNEDRFTSPDDFTYPGNIIKPSECDLPWLKNPQIDTFYIPFEVTLLGNSINYNIEGLSGNNINSEISTDQPIRLLYQDNVLITIKKTNPRFPNVFFYGLGMKDAKTIRGYIGIRTSLVRPNTNREGAHVFLKVTRTIYANRSRPSNN